MPSLFAGGPRNGMQGIRPAVQLIVSQMNLPAEGREHAVMQSPSKNTNGEEKATSGGGLPYIS